MCVQVQDLLINFRESVLCTSKILNKNIQHHRKIPDNSLQTFHGETKKHNVDVVSFVHLTLDVLFFVVNHQGADRFYRSPLNAKEGPENEFGIPGAITYLQIPTSKKGQKSKDFP